MKQLILPFLLPFLIAFILTPIVRKQNIKHGLVDVPKDNRRMHKEPMPVAGGIAIFIALIIAIFTFLPITKEIIALLIGSLVIVGTGIYDDKNNMSPKMKFLLQTVAAIVLLIGGVQIDLFTNPFYGRDPVIYLKILSIPITLVWIVGITNTINLIDGLDGLACGVSAIASIGFSFVALRYHYTDIAILSIILAGACLGFLPYNFHPAKIFMGDTGALLLGFVLAYITIEGVMKAVAVIAIFIPVLILGVPIFDTAFAMIRRKISGKSIVEADRGHLHHRLMDRFMNQKQTVLAIYGVSIFFAIVGYYISTMHEKNGLIASIIIIGLVGLFALLFGLLKGKES